VGESSPSAAQITVGANSLKVTGVLTNYGKIIYSDVQRITSNGTTAINDSANGGTVEYTGSGQVLTDFVATGNDYANLIVSGSITSGGTIVIAEDFSNTGAVSGVTALSVGDSADIGAALSAGSLIVSGTADIGAAVSADSVTVSGIADIGANVTTTAAQTYSGAVTISNTVNLTGSTVTFNSTVNDSAAGTHGLTVTGNAVLKASLGGTAQLCSFTVSGTTRVDSAITISAAAVTLTGGATLNGATEINAATLNTGSNITGQTLTYSGALNNSGAGAVSLPAFVADGDLTVNAGNGISFRLAFVL
jgi:cytoskeletal protein CcmA (bactofilin family)